MTRQQRPIVLIGSCGLLGTAVSSRLHSLGYTQQKRTFLLLDRTPSQEGAHRSVDISDHSALENSFKDFLQRSSGPFSVLHVPAFTQVDAAETPKGRKESYRASVIGSYNLAMLARNYGERMSLFHIGTSYGFGNTSHGYLTESDLLTPACTYAQHKVEGEKYVVDAGGSVLVTDALYGPRHSSVAPSFIETVLDIAYDQKRITVVHDQKSSPTYTVDLADLCAKLLTSDAELLPRGRIHAVNHGAYTRAAWVKVSLHILSTAFYVSAPLRDRFASVSVRELSTPEYYAERFGSRPHTIAQRNSPVDDDSILHIAPRPRDCSLATPILDAHGFALRPFEQALADYIQNDYVPMLSARLECA